MKNHHTNNKQKQANNLQKDYLSLPVFRSMLYESYIQSKPSYGAI